MKKNIYKILSLVLVLASLVSSLAIFASAENAVAAEEIKTGDIELIYNRDYQEGWDYENGFTDASSGNKVSVDYEELTNGKYNYFLRFQSAGSVSGSESIDFGNYVAKEDQYGTVIEMKIKFDDYAYDWGRILSYSNGSGTWNYDMLYVLGDKLMFNINSPVEICTIGDEWVSVAIAFDWTLDDYNITLYYGELDETTRTYSKSATYTTAYALASDKGIKSVQLAIPGVTDPATRGSSYCVDDLRVYNGSAVPAPIDESDSGIVVNALAVRTINILEGSGIKTSEQVLEDALCMKIGVNYALFKNERKAIIDGTYGAPVTVDGKVRIPLNLLLDYIGFPYYVHPDNSSYDITTGTSATYLMVGRDSATVDGTRVQLTSAPGYVKVTEEKQYLTIAIEDVETLFPGWLVAYDDMGLIIIYEDITPEDDSDNEDIVNRNDDLDLMLNMMKKFIFDVDTAADKNQYSTAGKSIYDSVKANTTVTVGGEKTPFAHPYLIAKQDTFDKLKENYNNSTDATLKGYVQKIVDKATAIYNDVALVEGGEYSGIKTDKLPVNIYDGYSEVGGRVDTLTGFTEKLIPLAFAYQVTGNSKFALLAYDYMINLGEWQHWGPGYMLDCAQATLHYALAYDWLYNAFVALQKDVDAIAAALFEKGVHHGYVASAGLPCEAERAIGDLSNYTERDDYWNAVGSAGMIIGAMALMDKDEYLDEINYLVGNNLANLCINGLDVYAPNGAFIESATNWCYGTNSLFYLVMSLESAAGDTFGFENTWGLDKTCYYALQIESSDGVIWNYHDGGFDGINGPLAGMETQIFNYVGKLFGDEALIAVRAQQLASGKKEVSVFDLLFYPYDGVQKAPELPLNYYMSGLEAYICRSDWSEGALYTGIMGGANDCNFGQIDSGNFIYHNKGVVWFMDLGSEHYAAYEYYGTSRNNYYRANTEGQNVVILTSAQGTVPYGQHAYGSGTMMAMLENERGTYAILENTSCYSGYVNSARRGLMVLDGGNTVVIQDELTFIGVQSAQWVAHTAKEITLSADAKTAWLKSTDKNGEEIWLRATLVSPVEMYTFSIVSTTDFSLDATYAPKESASNGGADEYSRDGIKKLVIVTDTSISFNVSVVFEIVDGPSSTAPVGYHWLDLAQWRLDGSESGSGTVADGETAKRGVAKKTDIKTHASMIKNLFDRKIAFTKELFDFYNSLTLLQYTFNVFPADSDEALANSYVDYLDYCDEYNEYMQYVNSNIAKSASIASRLNGLYEEPEVEAEE